MITRRFMLSLWSYPLVSQQTKDLRLEPVNADKASLPEIKTSLADRRLALVMGNNAYHTAMPLYNAVHDATDLSEALKRARFDVTILTDGTQTGMRAAVQQF